MEKNNRRGKVNAIDLVEALILVVVGWIGEKLLDSLLKGVVSALSKILARRRSSNKERRNIGVNELGWAIVLSVARFLEIDAAEVKSSIDLARAANKSSFTASIEIVGKMLTLSIGKNY
jgi:hypothetical protein